MIISNFMGGLGNQMFQYACSRSLSLSTGRSLFFVIDQLRLQTSHNGFELARTFNVDVPMASKSDLRRLIGWQSNLLMRRLLGRPAMHWMTGRAWANEPYFNYWPDLATLQGSLYLHGYWQSELYFSDHAEKIRSDFQFRLPWNDEDCYVVQRMQDQPSVSIHVRRGDYTHLKNKKKFSLCEIDYYRAAIKFMLERISGVRFFVFSDDPIWVKQNLLSEHSSMEIVLHNTGLRSPYDMRLMSQADHHIIANSSFSWWGAWLNASPNKIVVAPKRWFANGVDDSDLIPKSWVRL